jgi:4-hydroxy-tetrahydrodipicolinate synthase
MNLKGSFVAIVTPMKKSGDIDFQAFKKLLNWHIEEGTKGIVVLGTTGESATLIAKEREELIKFAIKEVNGRVPVLIGTGTNNTKTSIEYSQEAERLGADACLVVAPYYNKPPQAGMVAHFKAVANAVKIPVILYNVPGRTSSDILPETVAELATVDNIVAVKEATGDLERLQALKAICPKDFYYLSGDDGTGCEFVLQGGHGVISVTANVAPKRMSDMCSVAVKGQADEAKRLDQHLRPLHEKLFVQSNPIPAKWALYEMGMIDEGIRLPLLPLEESYRPELQNVLKELE